MLQVTDAAVSVLKSEVLREGEPMLEQEPATAVRIRTAVTDDGRQALTLQPVMGPVGLERGAHPGRHGGNEPGCVRRARTGRSARFRRP